MACQGSEQEIKDFLDRMEYINLAIVGIFIITGFLVAIGTTVVFCRRKSN